MQNDLHKMYIGFTSDQMTTVQINGYLTQVIQPKIETVFEIFQVQIFGGEPFAMRI
ncbi:hypothetical protein [Candidatus Coxiella mudrowiae]|uniref:hypothetical protein n=1 Tax=Candidatus Coxiella mudrowiae TaxID=2054173 RepID=UPI001FD53449|nr:hypothetical protein [Candidatus Coxiella mudrowiae]